MKIPLPYFNRLQVFPFYRQFDKMDCGPTCLQMVAAYFGMKVPLQFLREKSYITREGISMAGMVSAAQAINLKSRAVRAPFKALERLPLPLIVHWQQRHFVVLYKIYQDRFYVADPAFGKVVYNRQEFLEGYVSDPQEQGFVMLFDPNQVITEQPEPWGKTQRGMMYLLRHFKVYTKPFLLVFLALLLVNGLGLTVPFLTQVLVDKGIQFKDMNWVVAVLIAQVFVLAGRLGLGFFQSWLILHIGTRINISIIAEFLQKLARLPLGFFDFKTVGDILQRVEDHQRVGSFITSNLLEIVFAVGNLTIYSVVLYVYSPLVFMVFLSGSIISSAWIIVFFNRRRFLDLKRFRELAASHGSLIQFISGMREIKINNGEQRHLEDWKAIQFDLYDTRLKALFLNKLQEGGNTGITELKNILITTLAASLVISGDMTLGAMMAIAFIVGQLNVPLAQLLQFSRAFQDASLSLDRLCEVHGIENEDQPDKQTITSIEKKADIQLHEVSFHYEGPKSKPVLAKLNLKIPYGQVTAVVGPSGSGKTTLMKLLLKFYEPSSGRIEIGGYPLAHISPAAWRHHCGAVLQDGFIFSDTLSRNITLSKRNFLKTDLENVCRMANLLEFIDELPLGLQTKIGEDGYGLSAGQKQRILMARALFKKPDFLFLDEATNALDAGNEHFIVDQINHYLKGRTAMIIAHRLSTVRHADQILVLDQGRIAEIGNHEQLVAMGGVYLQLIKNQMEMEM